MKLFQLQLLKVLINNGFSVSKAAEQHFVVPSAVSRQISMLEDELGIQLFERKGKRLTGATDLCRDIAAEVADIELSLQNIRDMAEESLDGRRGELRIATTHTQAKYFLPAVMSEFTRLYPHVAVHFVQGNPHQLVEMLHDRQADIAICTEDLDEDAALITHKCYDWNHALIVRHDHPLAEGELSLQRIAEHGILTYVFGFSGRSKIHQAFKKQGLEMNVTFSATDTDVIKSYVRLGFGAGIIAQMAYDDGSDKDLVLRPLGKFFKPSTTRIAYLKQKHIRAYVQDIVDLLSRHGAENMRSAC